MKSTHFIIGKLILLISFMLLIVLMMQKTDIKAHDDMKIDIAQPIPSLTATPNLFPSYLSCPSQDEIGLGPTWNEIQIGKTTLEEFEAFLHTQYDGITIRQFNWELYGVIVRESDRWSRNIRICVNNSVITALKISEFKDSPTQWEYMYSYLAELGIPKAVSHTDADTQRALYWFEQGIVLTVFAWEGNMDAYGVVLEITYFPFTDSENYEETYPYNRAKLQLSSPVTVRSTPIPTELNPFDFEAIMATITPVPTSTPTVGEQP